MSEQSMPISFVRLHWGSPSTSKILLSGLRAKAPARLKQLVVLPVPPFNVPKAIDFMNVTFPLINYNV